MALASAGKLVGGIDALGNPSRAARSFSRVQSLWYEPSEGNVTTWGAASKSAAAGVAGGVARTTGSVFGAMGNLFANATFDDDYKASRTKDKKKANDKESDQKTANSRSGIKSFGMGIVGGVAGVVWQPIKGTIDDGLLGGLKGLGKGVVGLVAKPVTGIADLATGVVTDLSNAADRSDPTLDVVPSKRIADPREYDPDFPMITPWDSAYGVTREVTAQTHAALLLTVLFAGRSAGRFEDVQQHARYARWLHCRAQQAHRRSSPTECRTIFCVPRVQTQLE